jgi:hypothetical protein
VDHLLLNAHRNKLDLYIFCINNTIYKSKSHFLNNSCLCKTWAGPHDLELILKMTPENKRFSTLLNETKTIAYALSIPLKLSIGLMTCLKILFPGKALETIQIEVLLNKIKADLLHFIRNQRTIRRRGNT